MCDVSDMELLREYARQNSESAFSELVRRHVNLVYSAAFRHVGVSAQAEEISQAVFVILARKAGSLRQDLVLEAWLFETTRLTALSFLRGERRRQSREQEAYMQSILQESTSDPVWQQLAPLLDEAMMRLGRHEREAVMLRFFMGRSFGEIAVALNIKLPAAQKRVDRAVEKLRAFFAGHGIQSTTEILAGAISTHSIQVAPVLLAKSITAAALTDATTASTLTIIKGAVKMIVWTKTKMAMVTGAAVILAGTSITLTGMAVVALRNSPGQIGWWKLNQSSGATVSDSSRLFGHSGKIMRNGVAWPGASFSADGSNTGYRWIKGRRGDALQLDGGSHILLGNIYQGNYDQLSIACWIRKSPASWQSIVERGTWDNPDGIGLWADYSGAGVTFGHYTIVQVTSRTTVQDNQWHHVVGTMAKSPDGYVYSIYVDGNLDNTLTNAVGITRTTNPWTIGGRYDGTWPYSGTVSDVRIFDRALTSAEVRRIYNQ